MTAKILATLGALGLIATIWTADFRFLWTGLILLLISVGIAANRDAKRKQAETLQEREGEIDWALDKLRDNNIEY